MPHSPFHKTVHAPIQNLYVYKQNLGRFRISIEDDECDGDTYSELLGTGELLLEHCDFLEAKLNIKKREYIQLSKHNDTLEKENQSLEEKLRVQQTEIDELKSELRNALAETEIKILPSSTDDSIGAEVIPQDSNLLVEAEEVESKVLQKGIEGSSEVS